MPIIKIVDFISMLSGAILPSKMEFEVESECGISLCKSRVVVDGSCHLLVFKFFKQIKH